MKRIIVIGAGLAGCEAAYFLANKGFKVFLFESKRIKKNEAQKLDGLAELVCTNSLKSKDENSAHGLLKYEMDLLGSIVLKIAKKYDVGAGSALAVDKELFSNEMTKVIEEHENITLIDEVISDPIALKEKLEADYVIIATGPLTDNSLHTWIQNEVASVEGKNANLYFYDAIAPVVDADSLNLSKMYFKDRHEPVSDDEAEKADYLNIPMNKSEYESFITALVEAEKVPAKEFEDYKFFESCLPIDVMAERGIDTARFSCMKPIGLEYSDGSLPWAVVQLRKENLLGSAFNLVGFQTRLTYKEQLRVFRMLPGMEEASFPHLGSVHRNTFLNAKNTLNEDLSSKKFDNLYFAGQITGVEGYTESASMGLYTAFQIWQKELGKDFVSWPLETGIGALINYIKTCVKPVPSNINFGLIPPVPLSKEQRRNRKTRKKVKKELAAKRAKESVDEFLAKINEAKA